MSNFFNKKVKYMQANEIIVNFRKQSGKTQAEFAELLSISRATLINWETGKQSPTVEKLIEMASLAGLNATQTINSLTNGIGMNFGSGTGVVNNSNHSSIIDDDLQQEFNALRKAAEAFNELAYLKECMQNCKKEIGKRGAGL